MQKGWLRRCYSRMWETWCVYVYVYQFYVPVLVFSARSVANLLPHMHEEIDRDRGEKERERHTEREREREREK